MEHAIPHAFQCRLKWSLLISREALPYAAYRTQHFRRDAIVSCANISLPADENKCKPKIHSVLSCESESKQKICFRCHVSFTSTVTGHTKLVTKYFSLSRSLLLLFLVNQTRNPPQATFSYTPSTSTRTGWKWSSWVSQNSGDRTIKSESTTSTTRTRRQTLTRKSKAK